MPEDVLLDVTDDIATVTLNRPKKRNALSIAMRRELADALEKAARGAAVVVVTGAGSAFCAGMDTLEFGGDRSHKQDLFDSSTRLFEVLRTLPRPLIAAVNGAALGGGCALAAMCDTRIASSDARFGHPEVTFGVPASYATLLRVVPEPVARDLALTGRIVDAHEALALGMVREIAPDALDRSAELAGEMASLGFGVLEATKRLIIASESEAIAKAWRAEREAFHRALFGSDPL